MISFIDSYKDAGIKLHNSGCSNIFDKFLYNFDMKRVNSKTNSFLSNKNVGIWAITSFNYGWLKLIMSDIVAENVFLINVDTQINTKSDGEDIFNSKKVHSPHEIIPKENIDTIIVPNYPDVYMSIKKQCESEFPGVKRIIHITELF